MQSKYNLWLKDNIKTFRLLILMIIKAFISEITKAKLLIRVICWNQNKN
jgi:hypothetical protein